MKVFGLIFVTICLLAHSKAASQYQLQCTSREIGIRWPNYYSNSEYFVCSGIGGHQVRMMCNPGELFTFVMQACTPASKFIPPPPLNILPTSPPSTQNLPGHTILEQSKLPEPLIPQIDTDAPVPPILSNVHPPTLEVHIPKPPVVDDTQSNEIEEEIIEPQKPTKPNTNSNIPMPPTPEPTPPVVTPPSKKPPQLPTKKKSPVPPTSAKKKVPTPNGTKKIISVPTKT